MDLKQQRDKDRYARLTDEQKAQRNAKIRENYSRKKAGISQQVPCASGDSKSMIGSDIGTAVPASGACRLYQIIYIQSNEHESINMVEQIYLPVPTGLTRLFPIHENDEDLVPLILLVQEVSTMLQTVRGNADTSSGKYPDDIHAGEHKQIYLISVFWFCFQRH